MKRLSILMLLLANSCFAQGPNPEPRTPGFTVAEAKQEKRAEKRGFWGTVKRVAPYALAVGFHVSGIVRDDRNLQRLFAVCPSCYEKNSRLFGSRPSGVRLALIDGSILGGISVVTWFAKEKIPHQAYGAWALPHVILGINRHLAANHNEREYRNALILCGPDGSRCKVK